MEPAVLVVIVRRKKPHALYKKIKFIAFIGGTEHQRNKEDNKYEVHHS